MKAMMLTSQRVMGERSTIKFPVSAWVLDLGPELTGFVIRS